MDQFAYIDDISLGLKGVIASTARTISSLLREIAVIGIVANPGKTVMPPPKWYAPTAEDSSRLEKVDVRNAEEGGVMVVGVQIGEEYVVEHAMGVVRDGAAERLGSLACCTSKQRPSLPSNPLGRRQATLGEFWVKASLSRHAGGQTTGRSGRTNKSSSYRERERRRHNCSSRRVFLVIG